MGCLSFTLLHININVTLAVNNFLRQLSVLSHLLMPELKSPCYTTPTDSRFQGKGILTPTPAVLPTLFGKSWLWKIQKTELLQQQTSADLYKHQQQHEGSLKESIPSLTHLSLLKTWGFSSRETVTRILLVNLILKKKQLFPSYFRILLSLMQWQVWKPA